MTLVGCANPEQTLEIKTVIVDRNIPIKQKPRPAQIKNVEHIYIVTEANLEEFLGLFRESDRDIVFYAITPEDYQVIQLNLIELRRLVQQYQELVIYYENSIKAAG